MTSIGRRHLRPYVRSNSEDCADFRTVILSAHKAKMRYSGHFSMKSFVHASDSLYNCYGWPLSTILFNCRWLVGSDYVYLNRIQIANIINHTFVFRSTIHNNGCWQPCLAKISSWRKSAIAFMVAFLRAHASGQPDMSSRATTMCLHLLVPFSMWIISAWTFCHIVEVGFEWSFSSTQILMLRWHLSQDLTYGSVSRYTFCH